MADAPFESTVARRCLQSLRLLARHSTFANRRWRQRAFEVPKSRPCREIAAHAMHPAAWRRRRRTQIKAARWRFIRIETEYRPGEKLPQVCHAAINVAADVVGVVPLKVGGGQDMARKNHTAKARHETLDLSLDSLGHVDGRAVG